MIEILAIDDDLDFHEILKVKLPPSEYNLTMTTTDIEFFKKFGAQKFDLCLVDLAIDGSPLKGLEILNKIRIDRESVLPVIMLSNTNNDKIISNALEMGASDFTSKPLDAQLLITKIKAVVAGEEAFGEVIKFGKFPGRQPDVTLTSRLRFKSLTEIGIITEGTAFVAKGTKVKLSSPKIKEIFDVDFLELNCGGFVTEVNGVYLTTFEINPENKDLLAKAKYWLKSNQKA